MSETEYFILKSERFRLVRGAAGAAIYDLDGGIVMPIPPSIARYLHPSTASFINAPEASSEINAFIESLTMKKMGFYSSTLPGTKPPAEVKVDAPRDLAWLELTQSCNLRCIHCYGSFGCSPEGKRRLTDEEWASVLDQVRQCGFDRIQFIGGEPLQHPALTELLFAAARHSFSHIEVFSNLILLDEIRLNAIAANHACLATTLYSVRPEVHDAVTGMHGSFLATVNAIRRAHLWRIPIRVSCIVTSVNENRTGDIQLFVEELGCTFSGMDQARPAGRGVSHSCRTTIPRRMVTPPFFTSRRGFVEACCFNPCWKGKITVIDDGSVLPCIFSRECIAGNVLDKSLNDILQDGMKKYWSMTKDNIAICRDCEFRYACTDCRPLAQGWNSGKLSAKTYGCSYNPYAGQWE